MVYALERGEDPLRLVTRGLDPPVRKTFPIDGITGWRAWEHAAVALDGADRIVGFCAWRMQEWNRHVIVWHLYVDAGARGTGAGSALLEHALVAGRTAGATVAWLETSNLDHPAVEWYRRQGFAITGCDETRYERYAPDEFALFLSRRLDADT